MFNAIRDIPAPKCLSRKIYNHESVVTALHTIFHGKCYLCEQDELSDAEIEHFIPHGGKPELKYDWNNLFLACSRCNSIKSDKFSDLIDCTDNTVLAFEEIIHLAGNCVSGEIEIRARDANSSVKVINTVELLSACYNCEDSSLRKISKESLMEKIQGHFMLWTKWRMILIGKQSSNDEIAEAKEKIKIMCASNYPFSACWRWHVLKDGRIERKFPNIRADLGF
ncbi:HNH endonuclease [Pseudescherichia vulneris]|uniref:HNH endonuclease n=1 Tax=Pseudescherichia vulneris TaxID=566 RepID=UPI00301B003B